MTQAIIFDCFGVLTTDLWKEFTATLPKEQHRQASELNRAYDRGHLNRDEFLGAIEDLTGHRPAEVEALLDNEIYKNRELLDYISELKKQYKIGLLSNVASNWISEKFLSPDERQLFDAMVFSFLVGVTKPDARIYEIAADRLGVPLENCVMVDDVDRYCAAAEAVGMKSVVYTDFQQFRSGLQALM